MTNNYRKFKKRVYNIIRDDKARTVWNRVFHGFIILLIVLSTMLVVLETLELHPPYAEALKLLELVTVVGFVAEYALRIWTADLLFPAYKPLIARLKYLTSWLAVIDFLALLPFFLSLFVPVRLSVLRMLRLLRLLRLFKFNKYTHAMSNIGTVLKMKATQLISSLFVIMVMMIIASDVMFYLEFEAQPDVFRDAFSGFWWYVNTITTVGYGDIYPITSAGKLLSGVISLLGIGLVAVPTGIISAGFIEMDEDQFRHPDIQALSQQLLLLKKLQKEGILTSEEFENQKRRLLYPEDFIRKKQGLAKRK